MAITAIPHKHAIVGFVLQRTEGGLPTTTPATVPDVILPVRSSEDFKWNDGREIYQLLGAGYERTHHKKGEQYMSTSLEMELYPGMFLAGAPPSYWTDATTQFAPWAWGREGIDAVTDLFAQGFYATLFRQVGNNYETWGNVKCTGGSLKFSYGQPVSVNFACTGMDSVITTSFSWAAADDYFDASPYLYDNVAIRFAATGGLVNGETYTFDHSLEWDNLVVAPGAAGTVAATFTGSGTGGASLTPRPGPWSLPSGARPVWKGGLSRRYIDNTVRAAFLNGTEWGYEMYMAVAGTIKANLKFPRILITDAPLSVPAEGVVDQTGVSFEALGVVTGVMAANPAFIWTEEA